MGSRVCLLETTFQWRRTPRESCHTRHVAPQSHALARLITTIATELFCLVSRHISNHQTCFTFVELHMQGNFHLSSTVVVEDIIFKQHTAEYDRVEEGGLCSGLCLSTSCVLERDRRNSRNRSSSVCSSCIKVRAVSLFFSHRCLVPLSPRHDKRLPKRWW